MKKGTKLTDTYYYLEIKDLQNRVLFLAAFHSLREAVDIASNHVTGMDNYAKVYRELKAMQGAFTGVYFGIVEGFTKPRHAFVTISHFELEDDSEEQTDRLEYLETLIAAGRQYAR